MTLPYERRRSVIQAREFLEELRQNNALSEEIRKEANRLLRHYPWPYEVFQAAQQELLDPRLIIEPVFGLSVEYKSQYAFLP